MYLLKITLVALLFVFIVEVVLSKPLDGNVVSVEDNFRHRNRRSENDSPIIAGENNKVLTLNGDMGGNFMKVTDESAAKKPFDGTEADKFLEQHGHQVGGVMYFNPYDKDNKNDGGRKLTLELGKINGAEILPTNGHSFLMPPIGNGFPIPPNGNGFPIPPKGNGFPMAPNGNGFPMAPNGNGYHFSPNNGHMSFDLYNEGFKTYMNAAMTKAARPNYSEYFYPNYGRSYMPSPYSSY